MKRKENRNLTGIFRIGLPTLVVILQLLFIYFIINILKNYAVYFYALIQIIAVINIFMMVSRSKNTSYIIVWLIIIFILPVFGYFLYLLWGRSDVFGRCIRNNRIRAAIQHGSMYLYKDPEVYAELDQIHPSRKRIAGYLGRKGFPLYKNTKCKYFSLGEYQFEAMIKDIENAERYVFLEYFILDSGELWDRISEVLIHKAEQGVEIRLMFDDFGSIVTAPDNLIKALNNHNIQVLRFNPVHRYISSFCFNCRNHQKITVIDGCVGYTGGTNLADEYANIYPKHGHWKDTAIRLEGDAVWGLTSIFLQMWDAESGGATDYEAYRSVVNCKGQGFYQPFSDGPSNNPDNPAEVMYRTMIYNAKKYVYISTPYLVIDNSMKEALCTSAQGGTDVRIITPKIWDHWYVHMVTQSNYGELLESGVRIYEYTPGFIHAKTVISDDDHAICGSINMDYRSFYLHFENGVWICGSPVLQDIKYDLQETFGISEEISLDEWRRRPWYLKSVQAILRIFAVFF